MIHIDEVKPLLLIIFQLKKLSLLIQEDLYSLVRLELTVADLATTRRHGGRDLTYDLARSTSAGGQRR